MKISSIVDSAWVNHFATPENPWTQEQFTNFMIWWLVGWFPPVFYITILIPGLFTFWGWVFGTAD